MTPRRESGFTLVETMIALGVLTFGLLGVAQVMAFGLSSMSAAGPNMLAREKATEAVESVYTARDTRTITWAGIQNVADGGVFLDGPQPLTIPGPDGLVNTADDGTVETILMPGLDGLLGTADDVATPLDGFQREITITDAGANLRRLTVRITYQAGRITREYVIETFISSFA